MIECKGSSIKKIKQLKGGLLSKKFRIILACVFILSLWGSLTYFFDLSKSESITVLVAGFVGIAFSVYNSKNQK